MGAGLRLLEEREIRIASLRQALKEGEDSGFVDYSMTDLIEEYNHFNHSSDKKVLKLCIMDLESY